MDAITAYHQAIENGEIVACKKVRTVYAKLAREVKEGCGTWHYSQAHADHAIDFIETFCRHSKGELARQRVTLMLWQRALISAIFGFVDEDGIRRFKEALLWVPRKNGKSLIASAIALFCLLADGEPGADVACCATKRDQAKIVFDSTHHMVEMSPLIAKKVKKQQGPNLYVPSTMSSMTALARDSKTWDGLNLHLAIIDELHAIEDQNLYEELKQSQASRRNPLLLMVSSAGTVREGVADTIYNYAEGVINGTFEDERFLAICYEIDERSQYTTREGMEMSNPGLDVIKSRADLQEKVDRIKNGREVERVGLLTKDFNYRTSIQGAWLQYEDIKNPATFDISEKRGKWFIGGCDLSKAGDLTAACALFYDKDLDRFDVYSMCWLPSGLLDKHVKEDHVPYDRWVDSGLVRLCNTGDGLTIDYHDVTAWFNELVDVHGVTPLGIYYDAWSARFWVTEMESYGFPMHPVRQGVKSLSLPMEHLGAHLKAKKLCYQDNSLTAWAFSNTTVKPDVNGMIQPCKPTNVRRRIDPVAAILNSYVGLYEQFDTFTSL